MDGLTPQLVTLRSSCFLTISTKAVLNIEPQPYYGSTEIRREVARLLDKYGPTPA
jgi:hypothetical protein